MRTARHRRGRGIGSGRVFVEQSAGRIDVECTEHGFVVHDVTHDGGAPGQPEAVRALRKRR